jgi:hypothetical protein
MRPAVLGGAKVETYSNDKGEASAEKAYMRSMKEDFIYNGRSVMVFSWKRDFVTRAKNLPSNFQSGIYMKVPFRRTDRQVIDCHLLSVSAPPLDTKGPLWNNYVGEDGALKKEDYEAAIESICDQIRACAQIEMPARVVLSAFGTMTFLKGLSDKEAARARKITRHCMVELVKDLRDQSHEIAFTDVDPESRFWEGVNKKLGKEKAVNWTTGGVPGNWMQAGDLIVNASNPAMFSGIPGKDSLDGAVGSNSLCLDIHVFNAIVWDVFQRKAE